MKKFKTIDDLDVKGKRVLVRTDLNVPMRDGRITDMTRIARTATTIDALAKKGAIVIVLSHFGRPEGRVVDATELHRVVGPYTAEVYPVSVEDDYVVVSLR